MMVSLLRCHVTGRAQDLPDASQAAIDVHLLGQAKVGDFRLAVLIK